MAEKSGFPELQNRFVASSQDFSEFFHAHGTKILQEAQDILKKCETGRHLLAVSDEYNIRKAVSVTKNLQGYQQDLRRIFIAAPPNQDHALAPQALDLTGFLRLAEHDIIGMGTLPVGSDIEEREGREHARRLDQIVEMCRLTIELEAKETEVFSALHQEILARSYGSIYDVLIRDHTAEDLLAAYDLLIKK
jgi:hypothetical protein